MAEVFANVLNASDGTITTLASSVAPEDETISVNGPAPAPLQAGEFRIRVGNELMLVTSGHEDDGTTWSVDREQEGTTAGSHATGAKVRHVLTAGALPGLAGLPAGGPGVLSREEEDGPAFWAEFEPLDASDVPFTPAGSLAAENVQDAIEELDTEKADASTVTAALALKADASALADKVDDDDPRLSDARTPTGAAGGVLSGTYPNPGFAVEMATSDDLSEHASEDTDVHGLPTTQVVVGAVVFDGEDWTFNGQAISERPDWPGPLVFLLGDASDDNPESMMLPGDRWIPESE